MKKILLVEDDKIVSSIYQNKLSMEGFQVRTAPDGQVALELVRSFLPDLVVLDLMIPRLPGIDVLKKIRAEQSTSRIPVIVFTNTYMSTRIQQAWNSGATKCLCKASCPPKELIDSIKACLSAAESATATPQAQVPPALRDPSPVAGVAAPTRCRAEASRVPTATEDGPGLSASLRQDFIQNLPEAVQQMRSLLQAVCQAELRQERAGILTEMARKAHSLSSNASICDMSQVALLADAFEALLRRMEDPRYGTPSAFHTVETVMDCLLKMQQRGFPAEGALSKAQILVVDDEVISRKAVVHALKRVKLRTLSVPDSATAFVVASENSFDLIILDIDMAGMNGLELCSKLRQVSLHKHTPVVFVTCHADFGSRTASKECQANDLISKPFCAMELAVKAFVHILDSQLPESVQAVGVPAAK